LEGRDLAEFFTLEYLSVRAYFTVQMRRQKKWAEHKSAHLFQRFVSFRQAGRPGPAPDKSVAARRIAVRVA